MSAVQKVAAKFGSLAALARVCNVHRSTVCHWDRPRDLKGRDGSIPDRYHPVILSAAGEQGVEVSAMDLINV